VLLGLLACFVLTARAQTGKPKSSEDPMPGTVKLPLPLGISLEAVPELLYEHLHAPGLKRGQGIVVKNITPDSPLAGSGLQRHDIVLTCEGTAVTDGAHFLRLVRTALPKGKAHLAVIREGKERRLSVRFADTAAMEASFSKGISKTGGPPALNVKAEPLEAGKLQVTFTFYSETRGKLDQVTCRGSFPEIQDRVRTLIESNRIPVPVQDLVHVALKQLREAKSP
jgi:hypothetical protein